MNLLFSAMDIRTKAGIKFETAALLTAILCQIFLYKLAIQKLNMIFKTSITTVIISLNIITCNIHLFRFHWLDQLCRMMLFFF